jgi:hypothetical protein
MTNASLVHEQEEQAEIRFLDLEERDRFIYEANLEETFRFQSDLDFCHFLSVKYMDAEAIVTANPIIDSDGNFNSEMCMFFVAAAPLPHWHKEPESFPVQEQINRFILDSEETLFIKNGPLLNMYYRGKGDIDKILRYMSPD